MDIPEGWTTETVSTNGVELECYRTGEGPPVLMAHGLFDNGRRWVPLAADLREEYEVVTFDARGHGRSEAPETGYSLEDRVADLRGVAEKLSLTHPIVLGHSMGAATAAWTAVTHPDTVRGLVLVDPPGLHDEPEMTPNARAAVVRERLRRASEKTVDELIEAQYGDVEPEHARRLARAAHECRPEIAEISREGYPSPVATTFPDITCRTLVLRRDADIDRRVEDVTAAEDLQDGRLVHVPAAGHYVLQDAYDAAYAELRTFLRRL
jgi:pimeloyl-ACP methyl ester carboxylesterase